MNSDWITTGLPIEMPACQEVLILLHNNQAIAATLDFHYPCSDRPELREIVAITEDSIGDKNGVIDPQKIKAWKLVD